MKTNKGPIDRQELLTELDRYIDAHQGHGFENVRIVLRGLKQEIIDFPSAQPEIVRCKDCRHRIVNEHYGERGYLDLKAYCELDSGDPFELSREAENDDWFCADAERREEQHEHTDQRY